jgi:hypothetical protein
MVGFITCQTVRGTSRLTVQEKAKFFHVDFTSLLDTNLEETTRTLSSTRSTFLKINLKKDKYLYI